MRLWSLHPKYLDPQGLVALWREGLLAKKVLESKTKGYAHHPQLLRFRNYINPLIAINGYLYWVYMEAVHRGYNFSMEKISGGGQMTIIPVTTGQMKYECSHLLTKLHVRNIPYHQKLSHIKMNSIECNPVLYIIEGDVEQWEIQKQTSGQN